MIYVRYIVGYLADCLEPSNIVASYITLSVPEGLGRDGMHTELPSVRSGSIFEQNPGLVFVTESSWLNMKLLLHGSLHGPSIRFSHWIRTTIHYRRWLSRQGTGRIYLEMRTHLQGFWSTEGARLSLTPSRNLRRYGQQI